VGKGVNEYRHGCDGKPTGGGAVLALSFHTVEKGRVAPESVKGDFVTAR